MILSLLKKVSFKEYRRALKKIIAFILIPILLFFNYQALNRGLSFIHLDNAQYYLSNNTKNGLTEEAFITKMQIALDNVEKWDNNNPRYYELLASLNVWQVFYSQLSSTDALKQAQIHYKSALKKRPNHPFFWKQLAQTDQDYLNIEFSLIAMDQAAYYAHSNSIIMRDVVQWKIPLWKYLNQEQKQIAIHQIKLFAQIKDAYHYTSQVNHLLKKSGNRDVICSRLPRTQEFKRLCY